ncbi:H/ACA ribonucleoprotein complex non-core subunit NAF1-like [Iris pallida]|uniref:H/ACA ribonucleoprotein complex non-core subunit NAF1 n=1 Tax=Iris pallida TaxID=29817 RepID=A0AAX6GKR2_IRIPA|nr:H/ACA ribonucleoprotein complex non-core subunit NAF1-like [Iris pallida]
MLLDYYLNHHHLLSPSSSPTPTKGGEEEEEEEGEIVTPQFSDDFDFDPVKEWLLDLDPPPPPPPLVMTSPIDAEMEKVTLVEEIEGSKANYLIGNKEEDGGGVGAGGGGGNDGTADLTGEGETTTAVERVDGDLTGEEKNDSCMAVEEEKEQDDDEESGDESSSSSSSSSSSESSSSEEEEEEEEEEGEIKGSEMEEALFISDDEDEEGPVPKGPIRSKHELEDLPPVCPVEVSLEPHHQTMPVGVISSILDNRVIIEGSEKHSALNEGSILWITESRSPLGIVDEIFGPVKCPYYVIRYNSDEEVPTGISVGTAVSFVPEFAEHVLNNKDLHKKGYDASGDNDEELSDEIEFSDDEKEAEYRKSLRQQKRGATHANHDSGFGKRTGFKSGGFRKDKRPPISTPPPRAAAMSQQPWSQQDQLQAQARNIGQSTRNFAQGSANPGVNVGPSAMMMQTFPPQLQVGAGASFFDPSRQQNPVWANSFQPQHQPQPMNLQGGGFPMNPLPIQQFGEYGNNLQYQIQFNQALNCLTGGMMPYLQQQQQQFVPNLCAPQGNMPWFGGPMNPLAGPPSPQVGAMGQGGFGQVPFECINVSPQGNLGSCNEQSHGQAPPDVGQGETRTSPVQSNRGRPFRGSRPYRRGRHSYGGRGQGRNG